MALPAIRNLDIFAVQHEGQRYVCLRDPEGFVEEQLLLTPRAFFIAAQLDGEKTLLDVQYAYALQFGGEVIFSDEIRQTVDSLDQYGFLQTERFESIRKQAEERFTKMPVRPAYLAGKSYPQQPAQLRLFLEEMFMRNGGPAELPITTVVKGDPVRCLIAPHIDFHRGGHSYAHAYLSLSKQRRPEIAFIFGVAHAGPPVPFILTRKNFETPFGLVETDQKILDELEAVCGFDPYSNEILHRTEHSIEFQVVMLSYLYGTGVKIVPILCGSFSDDTRNPEAHQEIPSFLSTCRKIIDSSPASISVISGADLAHVGKRFGDPFDIDRDVIAKVELRDKEDLQFVLERDPEGFYGSVIKDSNERRVCGINAIYSALSVCSTLKQGELLHYDYAHDPMGGIVSFAGILFSSSEEY